MENTILVNKDQLAERLTALLKDFWFTWGRLATPRSDGAFAVSLDRVTAEDGQFEHLVTVFAGLPAPPDVQHLLCTFRRGDGQLVLRGVTDRRGQFRPRKDAFEPDKPYRLEVEPRFEPPEIECARANIARKLVLGPAALAAAAGMCADTGAEKPEEPVQEFHSNDKDETVDARIRQSQSDLLLEAEVRLAKAADRLAAYRITDTSNHSLDEGFVALYLVDEEKGRCTGEVVLERTVQRQWSEDCRLEVFARPRETLTARDREFLERSLDGTSHPDGRAILLKILESLPREKG